MSFDEQDFTIIDHTADLGLKIRGETLERLFENAAKAMLKIMVKTQAPWPTESVHIQLEGRDLEDLLVRWLGEILYCFEGEKRVAVNIHIVSLSPEHLEAILDTIPYDPGNHEILCEIKGVTYHQIEVSRKDDRLWEAKVIFDV